MVENIIHHYNTDPDITGFDKFLGTSDDGGTCRDHIVDNQDMLTMKSRSIDQFEDPFYILVTFPASPTGLTTFEARSSDSLIVNR